MSRVSAALLALILLTGWARAATVSGFVRDRRNGEPLPFASVYLMDRSIGTASDRSGYYVLSGVPAGRQTVVYSIVGYRDTTKEFAIEPATAARLDVRLEVEPVQMKGVTSSAERQRFQREVDVGMRRLDVKDLKIAPGMVEQDLFRSLAAMPGVLAISDLSSALYVRGGSPDQNLVLLDGVTVYNPYHLGGLFSTFNMDALSSAELKAGAFPAEYGGAVSSVLDVEMKQGNSERIAGAWDVGLLTSKLMLEGPLPRGSFLVAGRRTYIDAITWVIDKMVDDSSNSIYLPYYFYDLQAKANVDLSQRDRLTASGYSGDDVVYFSDSSSRTDFRWGNYTLGLKWRHIFSPELLATSVVTHGRNRVALTDERYTEDDTSGVDLSMGIGDWGVKSDWTWFRDSSHTPRAGLEAKLYSLGNSISIDTTILWDLSDGASYLALYAQDKWQPMEKLLVNAGLRGEYFTAGRYIRPSPRLSAKYFLQPDLAITGGWGLYYQYLSIPFPRNEFLVKLPAFFFQQWVPVDARHAPIQAMHYVLGAEKWLSEGTQASVEAYYKDLRNLLETRSNVGGLGLFGETGDDTVKFNTGSGWAAGTELLLRRRASWLGYGLAFTRRTFDSTSFFPVFDARHNVNVVWSTPLGKRWTLNLQWVFRSGFPYTGAVGQFQFVGEDPGKGDSEGEQYYWTPVYGRRGNYRFPPYHRLDVGIEKGFRLFRADWTFYFQVVNAYFQKNVLWYNYYQDESGHMVREPQSLLPIPIPSLGLRGRF